MAQRKLILFDIDGTLISPGPIPRESLAEALSHFLGKSVDLAFNHVAGFTDPTIIEAALERHGYNFNADGHAVSRVQEHYLTLVEERLPASDDVAVFPGAEDLVRACREENWATALLTGNVERGARLKLSRTGLWDLFSFGVFGDDGNSREDLPWVARERAWDVLHESFQPAGIILVGDTPNDARIANLSAIHSLIVCRRPEPEWRQAIEDERPSLIVDDFEDPASLVQWMKAV